MSYILQALARSERERKQLETRDLGEALEVAPVATDHRRAPAWMLVVVSVALLAVVLGLTWLTIDRGKSAAMTPVSVVPNAVPSPETLTARPAPPTQSAAKPEETLTPVPASDAAQASRQVATTPLRQVTASPSTRTEGATGSPSSANTPAMATSEARPAPALERVQSLPGIDVTIHVYSEDPRRRFVYVNGGRYGEGERIDGMNARVQNITREGLVVDLGDRLALLEVRQ
jgi:general secretion pathway protein B